MTAFFSKRAAAWASCFQQVAVFSASQLEPGHHLRPGDHALHLGLDYLPAAGQRLGAAGTSCRRKARAAARRSTNTRATPPSCLCLGQSWFYRGISGRPGPGRLDSFLVDGTLDASAGRLMAVLTMTAGTDLPDVARRADRRVRHRQRHQPADHGRHPGPHARRAGCSCFEQIELRAGQRLAAELGVED